MRTHEQNDISIMKVKIKSLEQIVQEMATKITMLQDDLYVQQNHVKLNSNDCLENPTVETKPDKKAEIPENDQLTCDLCEYKCKRKATMQKHRNTKHTKQMWTCEQCGEKFKTSSELETHIVGKHNVYSEAMSGSSTPLECQDEPSFVFSESMLDEFIY